MLIIGCDYHPGFQQISFLDNETGECGERRLERTERAEQFYRGLHAQGMVARIGMEASGHSRWFERLLSELGFELWIGDAAEISTKRVRKHKSDRQDAELLLTLLMEDRFPRIRRPSGFSFHGRFLHARRDIHQAERAVLRSEVGGEL